MTTRTAWWAALASWALGLALGGAAAWKMDSTPTAYPTGMFASAENAPAAAPGVAEAQPVDIDEVSDESAAPSAATLSCDGVANSAPSDADNGAFFMPEDTVVAKRSDIGATQMQRP